MYMMILQKNGKIGKYKTNLEVIYKEFLNFFLLPPI